MKFCKTQEQKTEQRTENSEDLLSLSDYKVYIFSRYNPEKWYSGTIHENTSFLDNNGNKSIPDWRTDGVKMKFDVSKLKFGASSFLKS
jgi:hypothetical protein